MDTFSQIIARLGGPAIVASLIEAKHEAVRKMAKRESIPPEYWPALIDAARAKRMSGVTLAKLSRLRKPRKAYTRKPAPSKKRSAA